MLLSWLVLGCARDDDVTARTAFLSASEGSQLFELLKCSGGHEIIRRNQEERRLSATMKVATNKMV